MIQKINIKLLENLEDKLTDIFCFPSITDI